MRHVFKPSGSSLLFRVSQSHVLSKIGGGCGQGSPNPRSRHGVDSQGEVAPSPELQRGCTEPAPGSHGARPPAALSGFSLPPGATHAPSCFFREVGAGAFYQMSGH